MTASNLLAWILQTGALVAAAAVGARLFGMAAPRARLLVWHAVLAWCLVLPLLERPRQEVRVIPAAVDAVAASMAPVSAPAAPVIEWERVLAAVLAGGVMLRFLWLALGMWKLRQYRLRARPLEEAPPGVARLERRLGTRAELLVSNEVSGPVTFGWRRPVVLVPERFAQMEPALAMAVVCHELIHVRRRDWPLTVIEECVRALFWFHPAIWWLLGEIQLTREQAVDAEVVRLTQARAQYVDALLAVAGARPRADLALAPLFLRRRHLKQRVLSIFNEVSMSKRRIVTTLAASAASLAMTCWLSAAAFPFESPAKVLSDGQGVAVETGAKVMHRVPVEYPAAARAAGVQGAVVVELALDKQGNVADAHVLSGPEDLRRAVLSSVLGWHYAADTVLPGRVQATIAFRLSAQPAAAAPAAAPVKVVKTAPRQFRGALLKIDVEGLPETTRGDLLNALPVRVGEDLSEETLKGVLAAVKAFDPHLAVQAVGGEKGYSLRITLAAATPEGRIAISDSVPARNMKIGRMVKPAYPPEAKQQGIQGVVKLRATVDKEGKVANLEVLSGEPLLASAAVEAVKQWEYTPAMLDGQPVTVKVDVDVNFALAR